MLCGLIFIIKILVGILKRGPTHFNVRWRVNIVGRNKGDSLIWVFFLFLSLNDNENFYERRSNKERSNMKTVTLTKSEIDTLSDYLFACNPCASHCVREYKNLKCYDTKSDGTYRCTFMRDTENICKKLGLYDED